MMFGRLFFSIRIRMASGRYGLVFLLLVISTSLFVLQSLKSAGRINIYNYLPKSLYFRTLKSIDLTAIPEADKHDKWVVLTSIAPPTDDVMFLSRLPGWKVLVVGDTKSPKNWSYPNCIFLDIEAQESLGLSLVRNLPYKSYTRKNVGYLYAIAHGAKMIYETDDDNRPLDELRSFIYTDKTPGLMFAGSRLFNPYIHFGQSTLWPRGYPLSAVGGDQGIEYRLHKNWDTPLIQQGLVNGDPDMDAIFRLTRKKTLTPLEVTFDPHAPPAIIPAGVFSPFNSQNTLFLQPALWALLLPTTTTFRMCDIWRGYWAQRLLWEIGGHIGFFTPNAYQKRNAHNYMADAEGEELMYYDTDRFVDFLTDWSCDVTLSFFRCVEKLSSDMAESKFWGEADAEITSLWLADLTSLGYPEPERVAVHLDTTKLDGKARAFYESSKMSESNPDLARRWFKTLNSGSYITFVSAEQEEPSIHRQSRQSRCRGADRQVSDIAEFCSGVKNFTITTDVLASRHRGSFDNVLLVVVFNFIKWMSTSLLSLEAMHRNIFPNIVYCGEDINGEVVKAAMKKHGRQISFLHTYMQNGYTGYNCFLMATKMNYNVTDYLMVSDDTLLNTWNLEALDRNKIWKPPYQNFSCKAGKRWPQYNKDKVLIAAGMKEFKSKYSVTPISGELTYPNFMSRLGSDTCMWAISDNYYIPARYVPRMAALYELFSPKNILLELLTPILVHGAVPMEDIVTLEVRDLWIDDRNHPWDFYNPDTSHFLHPVKWSNQKNLEPFCRWHLVHLLNFENSKKKLFLFQGKQAKEELRKWIPP